MIERRTGTRQQLKTTLAILAGVLLVGFVIGTFAARGARSGVSDHVSRDDYIVLVAQLYERERSVFNAQERLEREGITSPANTAANLAATYRLEKPTASQDISSLEELSQALNRLDAEGTAAGTTTGTSAKSESGGFSLVLVLILLIALGIGGGVATKRFLGINIAQIAIQQLKTLRQNRPAGPARARPAWNAANRGSGSLASRRPPPMARPEPVRAAPLDLEDEDSLDLEPDLAHGPDLDDDFPPTPPAVRPVRVATSASSRVASEPRRKVTPLPRGHYRFRFSYELGDEDYEELHPIRERGNDRLMGTCCIGTALRQGPEGGVYAFTAWVQDYASQELRSVGLITNWAHSEERDAIERWIDESVIDETLVIDRNSSVQLDTQNLSVVITIADFELLTDEPNPSVARLNARFDVMLRKAVISVNGH